MEPKCAVRGCIRPVDTEVEGDDLLNGAPLPTAYVCDDPEHQYAVALAILPPGTRAPTSSFATRVKDALAAWNEANR